MTKHCIICNDPATLKIKDTPDYYCQGCAEENFGDISMLIKVEEEAQKLKEFVKEKTSQNNNNNNNNNNEGDDAANDPDMEN